MKVLFITSSSVNGGAQKYIRDIFISLTKLGHDVHLVAPSGWLLDELSLYREKIQVMKAFPWNVCQLTSILNIVKPDITNTFILSGGFLGYAAWLIKKQGRILITVNNPVIYSGISTVRKYLYPRLYKWFAVHTSAFLTKSEAIKKEIIDIIGSNHNVISIRNGIDFSVFSIDKNYPDIRSELGIPKDAYLVTNVAALERIKGHHYLIEAARKLTVENERIYFIIIGTGSLYNDLYDEIVSKGLKGRVLLIGKRKDVNAILSNSDIFVLPSLSEGMPNSLMEAMSMGLPCVATDVGGVRELISDERLGIIIKPEQTQPLIDAIVHLFRDSKTTADIGSAAYYKMKYEFGLEKVCADLIEIYKQYK